AHWCRADTTCVLAASDGELGLLDVEKLAEIDFLNQPEKLVELVGESTERERRKGNLNMEKMTEEKDSYGGGWKFFSRPKLDLRAFIAQMGTGEGKSIVIAMLAVFMVQLHGLKVHVLENNEGLLERDYATYRPFFQAFGIRCGVDLLDQDSQVVYCLKPSINQLFLRTMLEGKLDQTSIPQQPHPLPHSPISRYHSRSTRPMPLSIPWGEALLIVTSAGEDGCERHISLQVLGETVIIVDEVDDLVVNENPNANYVKEDAERTPDMRKCFAALKASMLPLHPQPSASLSLGS
ncbi:MAG: hypothetical protein SGPRY_002510, partial [Prymnesium sp.]